MMDKLSPLQIFIEIATAALILAYYLGMPFNNNVVLVLKCEIN